MVVAIVVAHWKVGFFIFKPNQGWEYCASIAVAAFCIATIGPGEWSLDHAFDIEFTRLVGRGDRRRRRRRRGAAAARRQLPAASRRARVSTVVRATGRHRRGRAGRHRAGAAGCAWMLVVDVPGDRRDVGRTCSCSRPTTAYDDVYLMTTPGWRDEAKAICDEANGRARGAQRHGRRADHRPDAGADDRSAPTSSTGRPTSSSRWSTTSSPIPRDDAGGHRAGWQTFQKFYGMVIADRRAYAARCATWSWSPTASRRPPAGR